jgi:hypothetical protein
LCSPSFGKHNPTVFEIMVRPSDQGFGTIRDMNADVDVTQLLKFNHVLVQGLQGLAYSAMQNLS